MARHIIALVFAALALVCLLQTTTAFDLGEYIREKLQNTIEKEHITCSNYKEYCEKQIQDDGKSQDAETIKMTIALCEGILRIYVCDVDLDQEQPATNEE